MNCPEAHQHLGAWLDQALDSELAQVVEAHVGLCPSCRSEWEKLQTLKAVLQSSTPSAPRAALDERVMNSFHEHHHSRRGFTAAIRRWQGVVFGSVSLPKPALAVAGVVMIVVFVLAFSLGRITAPRVTLTAPPAVITSRPTVVEVPVERERPRAEKSSSPRRIQKPVVVRRGRETAPTLASWKDFEPIKGTMARVIRGGDQR